MTLSRLLGIGSGERVAVVGCGGKTSLVQRLAEENAAVTPAGVLIAPTTRMGLWELESMRRMEGVALLGHEKEDKLIAASLSEIREQSKRFSITLMEADGSKGLPLKGWAEHEPIAPDFSTLTVGVVSAKAVGLPAAEANVHRLHCFLKQTGLSAGDAVTEKAIARMILGCLNRCSPCRQAILVNQAEDEPSMESAHRIAKALRGEKAWEGIILLGSVKEGKRWKIA